MNEENVQELIDKAMAGRLSPAEEERWSNLLAERPELEEEVALGEALRALPAPPAVSSNFTALVMKEIARPRTARRGSASWFEWLRWPRFSRLAATAVVLIAINLAVVQHRKALHAEKEAAQVFATAIQAAPAPELPPEDVATVFKDFEAIRRLPAAATDVDFKLLAALQK